MLGGGTGSFRRQEFQGGSQLPRAGDREGRKIIGVVPVERYFVSKIPAPELEILFLLWVTDQKVEPIGQVAQAFFLLCGQHGSRG